MERMRFEKVWNRSVGGCSDGMNEVQENAVLLCQTLI
jgi:hypothetical protein